MSNFETSQEAAFLTGAIAKRAGLKQGLQQGVDYGYQAGLSEGYRQGEQAGIAAMQEQLNQLLAENAQLKADKELVGGLVIVMRAGVAALQSASLSQRVEFLKQYKRMSDSLKSQGYVTCAPHAAPVFRKQYPETTAFLGRILTVSSEPQPTNDAPSP